MRGFVFGQWRDVNARPTRTKNSVKKYERNVPGLKAVSVLFNVSKQLFRFCQSSSSNGSAVLIINVFCVAAAVGGKGSVSFFFYFCFLLVCLFFGMWWTASTGNSHRVSLNSAQLGKNWKTIWRKGDGGGGGGGCSNESFSNEFSRLK